MRETLYLPTAEIPLRAVRILSEACAEAIARHGVFVLALSGGTSPKPLFQALRQEPEALDWSRTRIFQVDERCVPVDHTLSNFGMMRQELLDHVPVPRQQCFPMYTAGDCNLAAQNYAQILTTHAPNGLDCVVLGMGVDGHTASLFPDSPLLAAQETAAVTTRADATRLTLTLPILNAARLALFYVPGTDKAAMLKEALAQTDSPTPNIPAQYVRASRVVWIMNELCRNNT